MNDAAFRRYEYRMPNGRRLFMTNRPDGVKIEEVYEFLHIYNPPARFSFTDDYVTFPWYLDSNTALHYPDHHWYPWIPFKEPPIESVWAFLALTDQITGPYWLHCDSATMRAPTYAGFYFYAHFEDKEISPLCDSVIGPDEMALRYSRPDRYVKIAFERQPKLKELTDAWRSGGPRAAYAFMMKDGQNR